MKCDRISKNLLAYVDRDISWKKRRAIQKHLKDCKDCSSRLKHLSKFWSVSFEHESVEPPPYFWSTLTSALDEYENRRTLPSSLSLAKFIHRYAFSLAAAVVLAVGISLGAYLGDFSENQEILLTGQDLEKSSQERFLNEIQLNSFDDLPQPSLGSIYVKLESIKKPQ